MSITKVITPIIFIFVHDENTFLQYTFLLSSLLSAQKVQSLTPYLLWDVGYVNSNGNYFKTGPELYFVQKNNNILSLNLSTNLGYMRDKFIAIPEVGIGYLFNFQGSKIDPYSNNFRSAFYSIRTNVSPWTITPEVGISALSLFEINFGYSFEFNEYKSFKSMDGFRFGVTIHIPTLLIFGEAGLN